MSEIGDSVELSGQVPLLAIKLQPPRLRSSIVARERLTKQLDSGLTRALILISAPVGFGKTTLLGEWLAQQSVPTAWLSLNADDNDPIRFISYIAASLHGAAASVGSAALSMLRSPHPPPSKTLLTSLLNDLDSSPDSVVLVLDDYHEIVHPVVHDAVAFLLANLPASAHLVIATRSDPPLPLSRLRARDQLVELRGAELLFTVEEAEAFLNRVMGLDLTWGDVATLESSTEGWIAGLQLLAASLRGHQEVSSLVARATGTHHYIADYLVEEVLNRQVEEIRRFLLETSVLGEMSGPLCDAVTGRQDSANVLLDLERSNLLLVPLDEERGWYRYHHLFRECLRGRLGVEEPDRIPDLYRRASQWYERQGFVDEALGALLAAQDFDDASRIVEDHALRLLAQGQIVVLLNRMNRLPESLVRARPRLGVLMGWALALGGQTVSAESYLASAERALEGTELPDSANLQGQTAAVRAIVARQMADTARVVELASQAIGRLPPSAPFMWSLTALNLGEGRLLTGDVALACAALVDAAEVALQTGSLHLYAVSSAYLARAELLRGRLREAERVCRESLRVVAAASQTPERSVPALGVLYSHLGEVRREVDDLDGAESWLEKALALARRSEFVETVTAACWASARVRLSRADAPAGLRLIDRAIEAVEEADLAPMRRLLHAERVDILLALGRVTEVESWARELRMGEASQRGLLYEREMLSLARLRLALGRNDEAAVLLEDLRGQAEETGRFGVAIDILILQALALYRSGNQGPALASLERALVLAEPEGYVRAFVDRDEQIGTLLRQIRTRGRFADYIARLLLAVERSAVAIANAQPSSERHPPLFSADDSAAVLSAPTRVAQGAEPLTARELEVLRLLATGASNRRIADELTVSVGTVKAHVSHILGKLAAHSRTEGIARASELGLIERH